MPLSAPVAPLPPDEPERLSQLLALSILDTPAEPLFDRIAAMAAELCGAPIALVSLVDADRQWFKANVGLPGVQQTHRDVAFCAHTVLGDDVLQVPDAWVDRRFASNPLVTGEPGIRFYAGAPLRLAGGARVGSLCVIDREQRVLDEAQLSGLRGLAELVTQALAMRRDLVDRMLSVRSDYEHKLASSESRYRSIVEGQSELISLARPDGTLVYVNAAYGRHYQRSPESLIGCNFYDWIPAVEQPVVRALVDHVLATGTVGTGENRLVGQGGETRWWAWTNSRRFDTQGQPQLHSVGRDVTDRKLAEQALHESQAFLLRTGRTAGVGGWQVDLRTSTITWSEQTRRIHEVEPDYVPTLETAIAFYTPESRPQIEAAVHAGLNDGTPWDLELSLVTATGRCIWVRAVGEVEFEGDTPVRLIGAFQDITDRREAERKLRGLTEVLRSVTEAVPAMIAVLGRDGRHRLVNSAYERWLALPPGDVLGLSLDEVLAPADQTASQPWINRVLAGESVGFEQTYAMNGIARHFAVTYVPLWSDQGEADGFVAVLIDISEHRQEQLRLRRLSERDALTGLLNRSGFEHSLVEEVRSGAGASLGLLYIDLDRFKPVNDQHGHAVGDELLKRFARRLQALVRPTDAVARMGGDEFVVLLVGLRAAADADVVAAKVVAAAGRPFDVNGLQLSIGASVGVAFGLAEEGCGEALMARADAMLYRAKRAGRGMLVSE